MARKSALSYKAKDNGLTIVEDFTFDAPKTKNFTTLLNNFNLAGKKSILVLSEPNKNVYLSARNIERANVLTVAGLNTYNVLNAGALVLTESSLSAIDSILMKKEA